MSIESVMPSNHLILYHPLLLPPSIFASIRVFSNESVLQIRWLKYWSFSFSISLSSEYSGLISFRMAWFDLLAVQGTLKSPPTPQFKSINSSVLSFLYSSTLTSNCWFFTCIQISQEAGQVVWYSHLFQNSPQFVVIHTVKGFGRSRFFFGTP